jgi:MYXO-CTERM domain-containing protein
MISKILIPVLALAATSVFSLQAAAIEPSKPKVVEVEKAKPFDNVFRSDTYRTDDFKAVHGESFLKHKQGGRDVPEFSGSAAGAGLALALGGLLALTGRRKRRQVP